MDGILHCVICKASTNLWYVKVLRPVKLGAKCRKLDIEWRGWMQSATKSTGIVYCIWRLTFLNRRNYVRQNSIVDTRTPNGFDSYLAKIADVLSMRRNGWSVALLPAMQWCITRQTVLVFGVFSP